MRHLPVLCAQIVAWQCISAGEVLINPDLFMDRESAASTPGGLELRLPAEPGEAFMRTERTDWPDIIPRDAVALAFDIETTIAAPRITVSIVAYDAEASRVRGRVEASNRREDPWSMASWTVLVSGFGLELPKEEFRGEHYSPVGLPFYPSTVPILLLELRADGFDGTEYHAGTVTFRNVRWITDPPDVPEFMRGDANADGDRDVSDAVASILHLFAGAWGPPCLDAVDVNDDGTLDITDPVRFLGWLFLDGATPPEPILCGRDPTPDELRCGQGGDCE